MISLRCLTALRQRSGVYHKRVLVKCYNSHGQGSNGSTALSDRFARGDSLWDILFAQGKRDMKKMTIVAVGCGLSWLDVLSIAGLNNMLPFEPVGLCTTIYGAQETVRTALLDLPRRRVTMDLSTSIGIIAAAATGQTLTSSLMTLTILVSHEFESLITAKAKGNVRNMSLLPEHVEMVIKEEPGKDEVVSNGDNNNNVVRSTIRIPLKDVQVGMIVRVKPGGMVPVDGTIVGGGSHIDEAAITGEALPCYRTVGEKAFASCINQEGVLEVQALEVGSTTLLGKIVEAVRKSEGKKAPVTALAEKAAWIVVYFALGSSFATYIGTGIVENAVSVLVVAGACGIAAGTPLAILGGIGSTARRGVVVKDGRHLQTLANIDTIVFDKTGTISQGKPQVTNVFLVDSTDEEEKTSVDMARFAAILYTINSRQEHPIAKALTSYSVDKMVVNKKEEIFLSDYHVQPGLGVKCTINGATVLLGNAKLLETHRWKMDEEATKFAAYRKRWSEHLTTNASTSEVFVVEDGVLLGGLLVSDSIRPEAEMMLQHLRALGIKNIYVFSGDRESSVNSVCEDLGIPKEFAYAEQSPDDKMELVKGLVREGKTVAFWGDGINDAKAMSEANIGIAMGSASALTQAAAGIVLVHDNLNGVTTGISIAKQVRNVIFQNVAGTIAVDILGTIASAGGLLPPVIAAGLHGTWDILFIANSCRILLGSKQKKEKFLSKSETRNI